MFSCKATVSEGGRVVIPASLRKLLDLDIGDEVILHLEGREIRLMTLKESLKKVQGLVRQYVPEGRSLTDELIAERRRAAKDE